MTECRLIETQSFPPQTQSLKCFLSYSPFPESGDQGQHLAQRRMDKKDRARARGIPLGNFEHNNGLKLCTETSTLQLKVLNGTA